MLNLTTSLCVCGHQARRHVSPEDLWCSSWCDDCGCPRYTPTKIQP